jgi:hypothetical protein
MRGVYTQWQAKFPRGVDQRVSVQGISSPSELVEGTQFVCMFKKIKK